MSLKTLLHDLLIGKPFDSDRVRLSNVRLVKEEKGFTELLFDIRWRNSWRHDDKSPMAGNWDAAWVFAKYEVILDASMKLDPGDVKEIIGALNNNNIVDALRHIAQLRPKQKEAIASGAEATACAALAERMLHLAGTAHNQGEPARKSVKIKRSLTSSIMTQSQEWEATLTYDAGNKHSQGKKNNKWSLIISFDAKTRDLTITPLQADWQHADIEYCNPSNQGTGDQAEAILPKHGGNVATGVFLQRKLAVEHPGPVLFKDVSIKLHTPLHHKRIRLFALEMVRIPEEKFRVGDPSGEMVMDSFYDVQKKKDAYHSKTRASAREKDLTYEVKSERRIKLGDELGFAPYNPYSNKISQNRNAVLPAEFPKGYQAFYIMKYQVSQGEYAAFINTLDGPSRTVRFPYSEGNNRYTLHMSDEVRLAKRPYRACNWLSWSDGIAFAAWAGLRPMTELEYEKACRGPRAPVEGEFAWGTTTAHNATLIIGEEDDDEFVVGNCLYGKQALVGGDGGQGPVREDAFATADLLAPILNPHADVRSDAQDNVRENTGSSYYGVLGLSGNLWEFCITVSNPEGRKFKGLHGQGNLALGTLADARSLHWPENNGVGFRGGSWFTALDELRIADRSYADGLTGYSVRSHDTGFRAVRTAPQGNRQALETRLRARKGKTAD